MMFCIVFIYLACIYFLLNYVQVTNQSTRVNFVQQPAAAKQI